MKRLTILLTALLTAALCAAPALAANRVETLTTDVALRADGSAHVTQVFSADTAEGTEFYVDRMDSGCLTYSRFAVSDENGSYAVLPDGQWDIDASFDEKAGKCGLLEIDGGVELCWGITEVYLAILRSVGRVTVSMNCFQVPLSIILGAQESGSRPQSIIYHKQDIRKI